MGSLLIQIPHEGHFHLGKDGLAVLERFGFVLSSLKALGTAGNGICGE